MDLPCSTTAVERGVKENTAVATMVSGAWQQDMVSWNRVSARERNPLRLKRRSGSARKLANHDQSMNVYIVKRVFRRHF